MLLEACNLEKPISYGSFQAVSCKSNKELKKYIFNKNNGKLYFRLIKEYFPFSNPIIYCIAYLKHNINS